jgi:hypothetical protein
LHNCWRHIYHFQREYKRRNSQIRVIYKTQKIRWCHYSRKPYLKKSTIVINWMFKNISLRNRTIKSQASTNFGIYIWICYSGTMHLNGYWWQHRVVHLLPRGLRLICFAFLSVLNQGLPAALDQCTCNIVTKTPIYRGFLRIPKQWCLFQATSVIM